MTFAKEDEVFPTVNILDTSVDKEDASKDDVAGKKEEDGFDEAAELNSNGKRKLSETEPETETETEKKVFFCLLSSFLFCSLSFLSLKAMHATSRFLAKACFSHSSCP